VMKTLETILSIEFSLVESNGGLGRN
jgi:hypothetical protein